MTLGTIALVAVSLFVAVLVALGGMYFAAGAVLAYAILVVLYSSAVKKERER